MTRDHAQEVRLRTEFIANILKNAGANGIIYGNSGGKDCTLVGILCRMVTENVLGVMMPCESSVNYNADKEHALLAAEQFGIKTTLVDLTKTKQALTDAIGPDSVDTLAGRNIAPRLRMTTLYTIGQSMGYLVAGTGNLSEYTMGYFTKWGDGAFDFNPIADLCATEVLDFLRYLGAPPAIVDKPPSAGLFEGQTDEMELGISYHDIDKYILNGVGTEENIKLIENAKKRSLHKYGGGTRYPDKIGGM